MVIIYNGSSWQQLTNILNRHYCQKLHMQRLQSGFFGGGTEGASWDDWSTNIGDIGADGIAIEQGTALYNWYQRLTLLAGEETAASLGIRPKRLRNISFLVAAFATAIFVSITGIIGFIGLMVPHLARSITGPLHKKLVLLSAIMGAFILLASDLAARLLLAPQELPVGIITTSLGGVFVLLLLGRGRR